MEVDWSLVAKIAMPIITLFLGVFVNRLLENREKLVVYLGHSASHRLQPNEDGQPPVIVNTHSVVLKNNGRKSAKNVRLGHNQLPNVNVFPDIEYEIKELPGGGKEIVFPVITPKKEINISYLYYEPTRWQNINTHIESDEGPAKVVSVLLQPQPKPIVLRLVLFLMGLGVISSIYIIYELISWLVI
jgi:hypothetical protein